MEPVLIPLRLGVQQRVLPGYRVPFFDALARACTGGLGLFAGQPRPLEMIETGAQPQVAQVFTAHNRHWLRGSLYLCWQSGLLDWLEHWQPEVLVVEANPRYLALPTAVRWMKARRRAVIGWGLGAPAASGLRAAVRRRFLGQFDAMVAYSRQGAEQYKAAGVPAQRVFVAPNAVAARPLEPAPARPIAFVGGQPTLLFVGRLQERKRIDLLLRACAGLPDELHPRLWVVGDGPARAGLEALAKQVFPETQFFGARYGPELEAFFSTADLFVLPGTGGLAVQQAMALGMPVVVAEGDGTQGDLVRPANGWQVTPGSLESLTQTLAAALADPARLRRMGRESDRIVREEINLEAMVAAFAAACECVRDHGMKG